MRRGSLLTMLALIAAVGIPSAAAGAPPPDGAVETEESAASTGTNAGISKNLKVLATLPKGELTNFNSDLAFWGRYAIAGNYDGLAVLDISEADAPRYVSQTRCPGSQNDVSVYRNIVVTSTDSQRNDASCTSRPFSPAAGDTVPWEGLRIWDWSDPAAPRYVHAVATDCGSATHTTIPDLERNRLIVYVSSYAPNNTANCRQPHDKISIVEVPLDAPAQARVIDEPVLFPTGGRPMTSGCRDITAYPAKKLALGACLGEGIVLDIADPAKPKVLATITDPNFSFWRSAIFSDDGETAVFTDERGGLVQARCRDTDPGNAGANAYYDISDPDSPQFRGYFKIQDFAAGRPQSSQENCTSHLGGLIPSKSGRDLMVQAWLQGGTSVIDFTDPAQPFEVAFFDRGPDESSPFSGHWASYWYDGRMYASEMSRGFDVMKITGVDDGGFKQPYLNPQTQEPLQRK
jgi:hypothetical protein